MARIRSLKAEFFDDEDVGNVSRDARLLFLGLLPRADREGRLEDRPARIKVWVFPYDKDIDAAGVETLLSELDAADFIQRYESEGRALIQIRTFLKHQRPHPKEPESPWPKPASREKPRPITASTNPITIGPQLENAPENTSRENSRPAVEKNGELRGSGVLGVGSGSGGVVPRDDARAHETVAPTFRQTPIIDMRAHRAHASCGRVCVPGFLHSEFVTLLGGDEQGADEELRAQYALWWSSLPADKVVTQPIPWLRAKFAETYQSRAAPLKPDKADQRRAAEAAFLNRSRESDEAKRAV